MAPRPCTSDDIDAMVRRMRGKGGPLVFVYEAGPCGYWLYRYLTRKNIPYLVVAPALIPPRPGDLVKTNKRDALALVLLACSGDLTRERAQIVPVSGPLGRIPACSGARRRESHRDVCGVPGRRARARQISGGHPTGRCARILTIANDMYCAMEMRS
jgi:hypothetical protein